MKILFEVSIGMLLILSLAGCFGEEYDFSPPTVSLVHPDDLNQQHELAEANINWDYDEQYNKETEDILSFAKKQNRMHFNAGQKIELSLENGHFEPDGISVSIWEEEKQVDLEYKDRDQSFYLPKEKGEYVIEIDLHTDKGNAQYVGNIVIE